MTIITPRETIPTNNSKETETSILQERRKNEWKQDRRAKRKQFDMDFTLSFLQEKTPIILQKIIYDLKEL